jgi:hypothetical protein
MRASSNLHDFQLNCTGHICISKFCRSGTHDYGGLRRPGLSDKAPRIVTKEANTHDLDSHESLLGIRMSQLASTYT